MSSRSHHRRYRRRDLINLYEVGKIDTIPQAHDRFIAIVKAIWPEYRDYRYHGVRRVSFDGHEDEILTHREFSYLQIMRLIMYQPNHKHYSQAIHSCFTRTYDKTNKSSLISEMINDSHEWPIVLDIILHGLNIFNNEYIPPFKFFKWVFNNSGNVDDYNETFKYSRLFCTNMIIVMMNYWYSFNKDKYIKFYNKFEKMITRNPKVKINVDLLSSFERIDSKYSFLKLLIKKWATNNGICRIENGSMFSGRGVTSSKFKAVIKQVIDDYKQIGSDAGPSSENAPKSAVTTATTAKAVETIEQSPPKPELDALIDELAQITTEQGGLIQSMMDYDSAIRAKQQELEFAKLQLVKATTARNCAETAAEAEFISVCTEINKKNEIQNRQIRADCETFIVRIGTEHGIVDPELVENARREYMSTHGIESDFSSVMHYRYYLPNYGRPTEDTAPM